MTTAELVRQLRQVQSMSIVGMCKNAGKTTMLNWLLAHTGRQQVLGLTSIGRDGESTDVVTGTEKPSIFVPAGTLIATAKDMLRLGDVTQEILVTTGIPTPLGEVIIMRARSDGYVQLAGPVYYGPAERGIQNVLSWGPPSPSSTAPWAANPWGPGTWPTASCCVPVRPIT